MYKPQPWELIDPHVLSNGVILRTRPVPPYASYDVHQALPAPPVPKVTLTSEVDGHVETHRALPGTPEHDEYMAALVAHRKMMESALVDFDLDYTAVDWKYPGTDEFVEDPPGDWNPPPVMARWNVTYGTHASARRVAFIKLALLLTEEDQEKIESTSSGQGPITYDEIKAGLGPIGSPGIGSQ